MAIESPTPISAAKRIFSADLRQRWILVALVILSLAFGLAITAFRAALAATPYETVDSSGREMGFNDVFSQEHYQIILSNCSVPLTLGYMGIYGWLFVAAHGAAIWLLLGARDDRWTIRFCLVQPLVFPWGVPGQIILFLSLWRIFSRTAKFDREEFIDIPYIPLMTHAYWILTAAVIAWRLGSMRHSHPATVPPGEKYGVPQER